MKDTPIEWADSSGNIQMGCHGCELWAPTICLHCGKAIVELRGGSGLLRPRPSDRKYAHVGAGEFLHEAEPVKTCYAGALTERYAGHSTGYPDSFEQPKLFLKRLPEMARWSDLTGKDRPAKPWLNGLPRCVFLNDMGDTFTAGLPLDWLAQESPELNGRSPLAILSGMKAIIMLLTKRADRMRQFFEQYPCPDNFIPMTSVTGPETLNRVRDLLKIKARWHGVSVEPLLRATTLDGYLDGLSWAITGAESGAGRRPYDLEAFRALRDRCAEVGVSYFQKQIDKVTPIPDDLNVRQVPQFSLWPTGLFTSR